MKLSTERGQLHATFGAHAVAVLVNAFPAAGGMPARRKFSIGGRNEPVPL